MTNNRPTVNVARKRSVLAQAKTDIDQMGAANQLSVEALETHESHSKARHFILSVASILLQILRDSPEQDTSKLSGIVAQIIREFPSVHFEYLDKRCLDYLKMQELLSEFEELQRRISGDASN